MKIITITKRGLMTIRRVKVTLKRKEGRERKVKEC